MTRLSLSLLALAACSTPEAPVVGLDGLSDYGVTSVNGKAGYCVDFYAGQTIDIGQVCFEVSGDSLLVTYKLDVEGWQLTKTHVWAGCGTSSYPRAKNGNPVPGQFPYHSDDITGATTYTETVALSDLTCVTDVEGECDADTAFNVMAHAATRKVDAAGVVTQTQTGWSNGPRAVVKGNWATYTTIVAHDDDCDWINIDCFRDETAWGYNKDTSTTFTELSGDATAQWGWSNGPLSLSTSYAFDLIAGAGGNDVDKGEDSGDAKFTYDAVSRTVTVAITPAKGWGLQSSQVWVGCDPFATDADGVNQTTAPGQLGSTIEADAYDYTGGTRLHTLVDGGTYGTKEAYAWEFDCGYTDPDFDAVADALPATATIKVAYPGISSYFDTTISGTGTGLDGTWPGSCIDIGHFITPGTTYTDVKVYSSLEDLSGLKANGLDKPDSMDLVNWVLSQDYIGKTSPGGYGTYTWDDVQLAIWTLIDNSVESPGSTWNQKRVDEIVTAANANGEGFEPGCKADGTSDSFAVILQPVGSDGTTTSAQVTIAQVTIADIGLECDPKGVYAMVHAEMQIEYQYNTNTGDCPDEPAAG